MTGKSKYFFAAFLSVLLLVSYSFSQGTGDDTGEKKTGVSETAEKKTAAENKSGDDTAAAKTDAKKAVIEKTVKKAVKKKKEEPKKKKKTEKKAVNKKDEPLKAENDEEDTSKNSGLLFIDDEFLKVKRISGIDPDKYKTSDDSDVVKIPDEKESGVNDAKEKEKNKSGLFGFSKNTTESLAKWSLVILLLLIFILYKARSKKSSKRVVRTIHRK